MNKLLFVLMCLLALFIGAYPIMCAFVEDKHTFLNSKTPELLQNLLWKTAFLPILFVEESHFLLGGVNLEVHFEIGTSN